MNKLALLFVFVQSLIFAQGEQRYADGTATDQDGNTFEWINYGTQDWAIENAEVVTYRDGTPIPQVTDQAEWANLTTGAWCYYNNDPSKGKLYNWYAAAGIHDNDPNTPNKEFAPVGWHVPTDADWITLENYLIANGYNYDGTTKENKIAKSMASTSGWNSSTISGAVGNDQNLNNTSGFNASTTGNRLGSGFGNEGHNLIFWSADDSSEGNSCELAWYRSLYAAYNYLDKNRTCKRDGGYVRLIKDSQFVTNAQILLNGTVSAENNQIKNVADPTDAQDVTTKSYVDNSVSNTYTQAEVDAIISETIAELQDQIDALQAATGSGTVTDQDGNSYPYLTYGDQVWTVKDAEMVTYRDGTPIPQVTDATEWANLTTGAWAYYENDPTKGKLYNWYAVAGIHDYDPNTPNKELAPDGWHVPSDAEWTTLENYLIANGYNYDGTTIGNKIAKAMASATGWNSSTNTGAPGNDQSLNNISGFNALPEGKRHVDGWFSGEGNEVVFWSTTESTPLAGVWERGLFNWAKQLNSISRGDSTGSSTGPKRHGFSVRLVKD